jgi:PAS domain S-box-containing protein
MKDWLPEKAKPLGEILVEQGGLPADVRSLLDALVQKHVEMHGGDPRKSLASVHAPRPAVEELGRAGDTDLYVSLMCVPESRHPAGRGGPSAEGNTMAAAGALPVHGQSVNTLSLPAQTASVSVSTAAPSRDRFRILRTHARGGLGEVLIARDEELGREVALKQIQARHAEDPGGRARFLREAEITGRLEHPGVVPIYGLGSHADGRPYYAMRLIRGHSLHEAIRHFHAEDKAGGDPVERRLELRQLLGRLVTVCNTVAYAHSRGVLHRDLKPDNIMLGQYGETLVVDWGVAKAGGCPEQVGNSREDPIQPVAENGAAVTQVGSVLGTLAFMSPEQAAGDLDRVGPASDVYGLGATLYCLLTGKAPYEGEGTGTALKKVQRGDFPPPRQVQAGVPAALEVICLRAMAFRPEDRYPSALALADAVERWLADEPLSGYTGRVFTISADGRFTSLVPSFEDRYGWPREEWLGKPFTSLVHPDDLPRCQSLFQRALKGETPPVFTVRMRTKSGRVVTEEVTAILQVLEGRIVGLMGIARPLEPAASE